MNVATGLTADRIGDAARYDPQLRTPQYPRMRRGITVDLGDTEVIVDGIPRRQCFRGALAITLLPQLIPLLDGTRSHAELAAQLEVTEDAIFKVAALLWASGVVEEGPPDTAATPGELGADDGAADFVSRMGDSTGAHARWEDSLARAAAARIEVHAPDDTARRLREALDPVLTTHRAQDTVNAATTLAVLVEPATPTAADHDYAQQCWDLRVPLLRMRLFGGATEIGPYVDPAATACRNCLTADDAPEQDARSDLTDDLACALAAHEIFALLTRTTPSLLPLRWRRVELTTLTATDMSGATRPGCPCCSVGHGPMWSQPPLAARYEAAVAMPPKKYADLKAHQMHYQPSNLALQQRFRTWPVAARIPLPEPNLPRLSSPAASVTDLGAAELGLLLLMTAGIQAITPERVFRWSAGGGNIGSVLAHVAVRSISGIDAGVYAYVAPDHALARLDHDPAKVPGDTSVTLVLTGDYLKVAQKYAAFALRIVLLDSGCAQATLDATALQLGVRRDTRSAWDDNALAAALGIDADTQPVTAVIDLGSRP